MKIKWTFVTFFSVSIAVLITLGVIGFYSEKNNFYRPSLEKYTEDTDLLKMTCEKFISEPNPEVMNKTALNFQLSKKLPCNDFNGECKAFFEFLNEAMKVSSNNQFVSGYQLILREKYEVLIRAIENGKMRIKNER